MPTSESDESPERQRVSRAVQELQDAGIRADGFMSRWREPFPGESVDGVLWQEGDTVRLTVSWNRDPEVQLFVMGEALRLLPAVDDEHPLPVPHPIVAPDEMG